MKDFKDEVYKALEDRCDEHRARVWEHPEKDLRETALAFSSAVYRLTSGKLVVNLVDEGEVDNYKNLSLKLFDAKADKAMGEIDRFLVGSEYPIVLQVKHPVTGQSHGAAILNKRGIESRVMVSFMDPRCNLITLIESAREGDAK